MNIYVLESIGADYYDGWEVEGIYKSLVDARHACSNKAIALQTDEDEWNRPTAGEGETVFLQATTFPDEDGNEMYEAKWVRQTLTVGRSGKVINDNGSTGTTYRVSKTRLL